MSYTDEIKNTLKNSLIDSSLAYLTVAINLNKKSYKSHALSQVIIGNLALSIELMLKAYLSNINPLLIFRSVPLELRIALSSPSSKPIKLNWRKYDADFKSFNYKYKTLEPDELIASFFVLHPELKQELHPHSSYLARARNVSIHGVIYPFNTYYLDKLLYLASRIFIVLLNIDFWEYKGKHIESDIKKILEEIDAEKVIRVRKKIEKAKEISKGLDSATTSVSIDGWEYFVTECPVCESDGILAGYTDISGYSEEDVRLDFFADTFECDECKLSLDDSKELELAGMEIIYDRNHEIDDWNERYTDEGYTDEGYY